MAEKAPAENDDDDKNNLNDFNRNLNLSDVSTTTTDNSRSSHEDTLRSELSYVTEDEDSHPISSLEPTIDFQPDLNLLASLTDDSLEDTTTVDQFHDNNDTDNMYGGYFDDNYTGCHTANRSQGQPMRSPSLLEQHLTNTYPYRWWTSTSYPTTDNDRNYFDSEQSGSGRPLTSTVPDYPQYGGTSTFMLEDQPHSALTATMTYSEVPRIKLQTFYGMSHVGASRQATRSYMYPLVSQPAPPTPPPPPYGAFHSTVMHNMTSSSRIYPTRQGHCPMDTGSSPPVSSFSMTDSLSETDSHGFKSQYQQRSTDSQLWLSNYRTTLPNCSNVEPSNYLCETPSSDLDECQKADGGFHSRNIETVHSTKTSSISSQEVLGNRVNPIIASVLDRLESANSLLDLSKQNQPVNSRGLFESNVTGRMLTNVVDTPMTNTFTQANPRTVVSCGMRPPALTMISTHNTSSPLQTLPSFSSQFGTSCCSSCVDPKKRKSVTVRELLQDKSKKMAVTQPVISSAATRSTTTASQLTTSCSNQSIEECRMLGPTGSNCVSTLGTYPISSVRHAISTTALEPVRSKNPPPYPKQEIRFPVPIAQGKATPLRVQPFPVVFLQNVPQGCGDKQVLTNWKVMLPRPSVHQDQRHPQQIQQILPRDARSVGAAVAAAVGTPSEPIMPRYSLLREALSGGLRSYGTKTSYQVSTPISMPVLVPTEKETKTTESIKPLLTSNEPSPSQVVSSGNNKQVVKIESINFRPQHYAMEILQIGSYVVKNSSGFKCANKFKILFAKRKFVYEFQVVNVALPNHDRSVPHTATVEVPFSTINALHCNEQEIVVVVSQTPELFLCCKRGKSGVASCANHYERGRKTDVTGGMLRTNHLHKIYLRKCRAEILRTTLESFDASFKMKMETPILEVIEISNLGTTGMIGPQLKRQRVVEVIQPVTASTAKDVVVMRNICHCQVSCRSNRCSCMKNKNKCGRGSSECMCKNCNNPLNVLDLMGLSTEACTSDICLIHNIVSYKGDLKELLDRKVTFPCCDTEVTIKECIPGKRRCSNGSCNRLYKFSWCDFELQDEEKEPRNHCSVCRSCQGCVDLHCNSCRRCNPIKTNGTNCPECNNHRDTSFTEIRDIANVLLLLAHSKERIELEKEAESRVLEPRGVNVQVVNVDDSEDFESIQLRAPDAVSEIEIEVEGESFDESESVRGEEESGHEKQGKGTDEPEADVE